jgi:hypothetical protein
MENSVPFEIIAAPVDVWIAPVGAAFPEVDQDPDSSEGWVRVGSSGNLNYSDDGVTVEHSQNMNLIRALGDAGSRKAVRTSEDLKIRLTILDLTIDQYAHALNGNTVSTVPASSGVPGTKTVGLSRGLSVDTKALLVRGPSPYMADGILQFEVPRAAQTGNPSIVMRKDQPAGLALEWTALVDPDASSADERFGRLVGQTDVAAS